MSHIVTIATEVRDPLAVAAACRRLGLPEPVHGTATLFEGQATGLIVRLPGWLYPAVADTATGQLRYDNFGGSWGPQEQLNKFVQMYAVVKARIEALKRGHSVREQPPGRRLDQAHHHGGRCLVKTIQITVGPAGETRVETKDYTGGECRAASAFVEQSLGRKASEALTAEYYPGQVTGQELRQSQGS